MRRAACRPALKMTGGTRRDERVHSDIRTDLADCYPRPGHVIAPQLSDASAAAIR